MHGMTPIVKTVARGMAGMIFLYGIYIVLHGHLTPGGGFAGGVVLSASFILVFLAKGAPQAVSEVKKWRSSVAESLGIFAFWTLAVIGLIGGTFFFHNFLTNGKPFRLLSAGFIPLNNIAIGVEVGGALFAVFVTLAVLTAGGKE
jgi:multisubunit Na+/H+ antiporter MnhB subunit